MNLNNDPAFPEKNPLFVVIDYQIYCYWPNLTCRKLVTHGSHHLGFGALHLLDAEANSGTFAHTRFDGKKDLHIIPRGKVLSVSPDGTFQLNPSSFRPIRMADMLLVLSSGLERIQSMNKNLEFIRKASRLEKRIATMERHLDEDPFGDFRQQFLDLQADVFTFTYSHLFPTHEFVKSNP